MPSVTAHARSLISSKRLSLSWPRVEPIVHGAQPRLENVRINLRGRQIGVAQHHLNRAQAAARLGQVRPKRMAHDVWTEHVRQTGAAPVAFQDFPEPDAAETAAANVQKDKWRPAPFRADESRPPVPKITSDPQSRLIA